MSIDYAQVLNASLHPALALPRLLAALKFFAPEVFAAVKPRVAAMPPRALVEEDHPWWLSTEGLTLVSTIFDALDGASPPSVTPANDTLEEVRCCARCGVPSSGDITGRQHWTMRSISALRVIDLCPDCARH